MSNSEYHFDVQRKSYEYEQSYENDSKLSPDTYESASENLLTDYEVVSNEEADEGDTVEVAYRKLRREKTESAVFTKNSPRHASCEHAEFGKLHLSLSAEKISLKSVSEKIDKSNASLPTEIAQQIDSANSRERCGRVATSTSASGFCPRHRRQQPQQQQLEKAKPKQYAPINFTIVPINVAAQRRINERKPYENSRDLPEIVLTSFEQQQQQQTKQQSMKACKPSASPGFDEDGATKRRITTKSGSTAHMQQKQQQQQYQQYQQSQQYRSVMLSKAVTAPPPPLPPPPASPAPSPTTTKIKKVTRFSRAPEFTNNHFELLPATTATATADTATAPALAAKKLPEAEDTSISEINSQPGSSTSPESLMDNVLSAASSVSVRSSSLSSAGGGSGSGSGGSEIRKILNVTQSESLTRNVPHVAVAAVAKEQQQPQSQQQVVAQTKELYDNRSLNLKSPITRGLSPLMTITAVKQATTMALTPVPPTPIATTPLQLLSPARSLTPSPSSVLALGAASSARSGETCALQPTELIEASANRSRCVRPYTLQWVFECVRPGSQGTGKLEFIYVYMLHIIV